MYQGFALDGVDIVHVRDVVPGTLPEPNSITIGSYYVVSDTIKVSPVIAEGAVFAARFGISQLLIDGVLLNRTYRK